ncbi:SAM-dependent methyltransferase [Streptomyces sp. Tu 6176]|uniref:class I SAM-dependent methyltransferase n=1 Tax=Streptomyces sp. Tu 6176 TaxID=1470557 RepID=UPI000452143D|nr:class I SAM-dependent methyltransferase [Streptomyces sp. Tu 6176]EYT81940.1 SAM-dependent methyltransferase [Streptomyces sp. Tu 6176]
MVADNAAAFAGVSTSLGVRLGLYTAMAGAGPLTSDELAARTGLVERCVQEWLPALEGVEAKLRDGASVADVGCGFGRSTVLMATAFPRSRFHGFDFHEPSVEAARKPAEEAGVADRVTFEVAAAHEFPGGGYDLVTFFDCLHDLGDFHAEIVRSGGNEILSRLYDQLRDRQLRMGVAVMHSHPDRIAKTRRSPTACTTCGAEPDRTGRA